MTQNETEEKLEEVTTLIVSKAAEVVKTKLGSRPECLLSVSPSIKSQIRKNGEGLLRMYCLAESETLEQPLVGGFEIRMARWTVDPGELLEVLQATSNKMIQAFDKIYGYDIAEPCNADEVQDDAPEDGE